MKMHKKDFIKGRMLKTPWREVQFTRQQSPLVEKHLIRYKHAEKNGNVSETVNNNEIYKKILNKLV